MLKHKLIPGVNDGRYWSCCQSIYHPLNQVMICSPVLFDISIFDRRFTMIDHPTSYLSTCLLINTAHSLLESNTSICWPLSIELLLMWWELGLFDVENTQYCSRYISFVLCILLEWETMLWFTTKWSRSIEANKQNIWNVTVQKF